MPKIAIAQVAPVFLNKAACVEKAVAVIAEAARHGAELVVFPETWIATYPLWSGGAAGWDDPDAKEAFALLHANSVDVPGPEVDTLVRSARENEVIVVMGVNERNAEASRGTLFNTLLTIDPDKGLLGRHRKLMPTHAERLFWGLGDGSDIRVHETSIGRLGSAICWEHWMPLNRFALHSLGEQVHVAVFPDVNPIHQLAVRSYAFEGRTFVIAAGTYMGLESVPAAFPLRHVLGEEDPKVLLAGGSAVAAPDGEWVVEPVLGYEEIIYADIDLARISREQFVLDVAGHYNRPDVFQLRVFSNPKPAVCWDQASLGNQDSEDDL